MQCRKCQSDLTEENISLEIAAHDDDLLDIVITCPDCGYKINDFVYESDFVGLDDDVEISTCIGCGCTDNHACFDFSNPNDSEPCHWLRRDGRGSGICSECEELVDTWDKEERS